MKYKKEDNIEIWHYKDDIWYQETTHIFDALNPYLCDSDWDWYQEDEIVCEFVLDETQNMSMEERNKMRHVVMELNHKLESGDLEDLIETLKQNTH